ncbi:hypothetical protein GUITHDRAFT_153805 [Guillardia theta CCMP2712]|uniref:Uncharacterized protein n=1 Tax=Guillardia theta (strain CCMP2712) TaxID=905079 RepID=L1J033_GUITC|nr:hypothetical protein GUITHDRAFT_153805 [Guillardia theta CCMP2712]EKX41440.1 hypothetical protein GUITHDRAFT_153805 [Guillardia theta CCMP2712]|eukprot:XP_005828420.1 hypothetical protein GUITHDRAFT_153805 [Guillardia theta CCMP2712]
MMAHGVSNVMSDAGSNGRLNESESEEGAEVSREGTPERNAVLVSSQGQGNDGNGEIQVGGDDFEWEGCGPGRHMIPLGWPFPLRCRVRNMFMWWNLGQDVIVEGQVRRIRPLKHLSQVPFSADVKDENTRKNVYKQVSIEKSLAVEDHQAEANRNRESGQRTYADMLQST